MFKRCSSLIIQKTSHCGYESVQTQMWALLQMNHGTLLYHHPAHIVEASSSSTKDIVTAGDRAVSSTTLLVTVSNGASWPWHQRHLNNIFLQKMERRKKGEEVMEGNCKASWDDSASFPTVFTLLTPSGWEISKKMKITDEGRNERKGGGQNREHLNCCNHIAHRVEDRRRGEGRGAAGWMRKTGEVWCVLTRTPEWSQEMQTPASAALSQEEKDESYLLCGRGCGGLKVSEHTNQCRGPVRTVFTVT